MAYEMFIVAVDLGGQTAPMLVPYFDNRCPSTGADVDHLAVDPGLELVLGPSDEEDESVAEEDELEVALPAEEAGTD